MFETELDGDNVWYLDNGASNHMTGNRAYFSKIDESITGKVRFGDDSCIDIKGKGSILFMSKNGDPWFNGLPHFVNTTCNLHTNSPYGVVS